MSVITYTQQILIHTLPSFNLPNSHGYVKPWWMSSFLDTMKYICTKEVYF